MDGINNYENLIDLLNRKAKYYKQRAQLFRKVAEILQNEENKYEKGFIRK